MHTPFMLGFFFDVLGTYQISDSKLDSAWSGLYNREACEKEERKEKGWETPALSGCKRLYDGKPDDKRDCGQFRDTGDAVLQIPISMPVSRKYTIPPGPTQLRIGMSLSVAM